MKKIMASKTIISSFALALFVALLFSTESAYAQAKPDSLKGFRQMDGDDPQMISALQMLRSARETIQKAEADKGGHRAKAIKEVNQAIMETKKGIVFDRKNITEKERKEMMKESNTQ
jgi:hypothetical protein